MTKLTLSPPIVKELEVTAEPKVGVALTAIETFLNGKELDGTTNIKEEGVLETNLSAAVQTKLNQKTFGLEYKAEGANFEAESGKLYGCTAALTATMPAATANRIVGLTNLAAVAIKVSAKAGKTIVGDFVNQEVVELMPAQHLLLEANGSNWTIVAGEPKREQKYALKTYTKAEAEAAPVLSANRPAMAVFKTSGGGPIELGGSSLGFGSTFWVNPGQKFKATEATEVLIILL